VICRLCRQFDQYIAKKNYLDALNFALNLPNPSQFRCRFRQENIFLKAMIEAVNGNGSLALVENFLSEDVQNWFIEHYSDETYRFLKAYALMVSHARSTDRLMDKGPKDLKDKTGFPIGFVLDLFHLLKNRQVIKPVEQTKRRVQVLLACYGAAGIAAHLFIEQIKFDLKSVELDTEIVSEPHPDEMFSISIAPSFKNTLVRAFEYVSQALLREGKKEIPVFRWWLKPASGETEIYAIDGNSLYGAFVVGMLCSARNEKVSPKLAITCDGSQYGRMLPIVDDLGCQAAHCR